MISKSDLLIHFFGLLLQLFYRSLQRHLVIIKTWNSLAEFSDFRIDFLNKWQLPFSWFLTLCNLRIQLWGRWTSYFTWILVNYTSIQHKSWVHRGTWLVLASAASLLSSKLVSSSTTGLRSSNFVSLTLYTHKIFNFIIFISHHM